MDFTLDDADLDLLDILVEPSPRGDSSLDLEGVEDILPLHNEMNETPTTQKWSKPVLVVPQVTLLPPTSAEAIMSNATAKLRASGLSFLEEKATPYLSLEDFRETFYGGGDGSEEADDDHVAVDDEECSSSQSKRKRGSTCVQTTTNTTKRCSNPDAELIAASTEEQMNLLGIDPNSREGKQQRRRIRNRMSAQLHRERKAMYIDALESFVRIKDARIKSLESQVHQLSRSSNATILPQPRHNSSTSAVSVSASSLSGTGSSIGGETSDEFESISSGSSHDPSSPIPLVSDYGTIPDVFALDEGDLLLDDSDFINQTIDHGSNKRTRGSNRVRITGSMRHILPMLSVVCMIALCFSGDGTISTSNSAMIGSSNQIEEQQQQEANLQYASRRLMALPEPDDVSELSTSVKSVTQVNMPVLPTVDIINGNSHENIFKDGSWSATPSNTNENDDINSKALWRYTRDDMILKLYPRDSSVLGSDDSQNHTTNRSNTNTRAPRYLRTRHAVVPLESSDNDPIVSSSSSSNALVAMTTSDNAKQTVQSRVLMIDGKALLDPSMALSKSLASSSTVSSTNTNGDASDVNQLTMLLPTSSIRWGHDWSDSAQGTTAALLAGLNLSKGHTSDVQEDTSDMYIELVCSISSAHLVKNVTTRDDM
jgi:hypothetical protein